MDLSEVFDKAAEKMKSVCRGCKFCDGRMCAGEVPGMGGIGTGTSFTANIEALKRIKLNLRTIHDAVSPDTVARIFGKNLRAPVLIAPIGGMNLNANGVISEEEYNDIVVKAGSSFGTFTMTGDGPDQSLLKAGLAAISKYGNGIPIIKPLNKDEILRRFGAAQEAGAIAVGIDIDAAGLVNMTRSGQAVGPKTEEQLSEVISKSPLPVILKGIMTPEDAIAAARAGAAAIVVSNHGGRVLDYTPGTAEVLSRIAVQVKGKVTIMVDGGIRSGLDALKMLALGADAVLVGRPVMRAAIGGGVKGVDTLLERYLQDLKTGMILTGCKRISDIDNKIIYY